MHKAKYLITEGESQFSFALIAPNNETIGVDRGFQTENECINCIEQCRRFSQFDENFEIFQSPKNNRFYFRLVNKDNDAKRDIILTSEDYNSKAACEKGIAAVQRFATNAVLEAKYRA